MVAVQGQNVTIPAGYAAGAEWQVMLPTAKVVQQSGRVGMAQLLGGADRIHINQRMMMFEALSCGMFEQKNKYDIRIGDEEGPTVMVATDESKPWTRLCGAPRHDRPATYRFPAGLHKQTRYRRARAISKHGCRPVTLGDLVPHYLHHIFITAKPERRAMPRRNGHTELRPSPRNQDT